MTLKKAFLISAAFILIGAGCSTQTETTQQDTQENGTTITFDGATYSPKNLNIEAGETVVFRNASNQPFWPASAVHPTHTILPEFDALGPIPAGTDYSFTFTKAGEWRWHDHMRASLNGAITVK